MKHAIIIYLLGATGALAHRGHDAAYAEGTGHWLTAPDHALVLGLAGFALGFAVWPLLRWTRARRARA